MSQLPVTIRAISEAKHVARERPEELWVERCLDLAYLPDDASPRTLREAVRVVRGYSVGETPDPTFGGRRVRGLLREVLANYPRGRRLEQLPAGVIRDVVVEADMVADEKGQLSITVAFLLGSDEAAVRLLTAFLDDRKLGIGKQLRRCELASCARVFISRASKAGGPRRKYCADEHRELADRQDASNRMSRKRKADKRAAALKGNTT